MPWIAATTPFGSSRSRLPLNDGRSAASSPAVGPRCARPPSRTPIEGCGHRSHPRAQRDGPAPRRCCSLPGSPAPLCRAGRCLGNGTGIDSECPRPQYMLSFLGAGPAFRRAEGTRGLGAAPGHRGGSSSAHRSDGPVSAPVPLVPGSGAGRSAERPAAASTPSLLREGSKDRRPGLQGHLPGAPRGVP